jgi:hypothetical protein
MLRWLTILAALATVLLARGADAGSYRRGIAISDYLAYPDQGEWPIFRGQRALLTDSELRRLRSAGFDFIRLAVEPGPLMDRPEREAREIEQRFVDVVRRANAANLKVIVVGWPRREAELNWRPETILAKSDSAELDAYLAFLLRIISLLADAPPDMVALAPMNEPQAACRRSGDGPDWVETQRTMYQRLRRAAPRLTLVLTTGCWSRVEALRHLDMAGYDDNTLIDLHYYEPWAFTHQATTWNDDWVRHLAGLSFPPERTDRARADAATRRLFEARARQGGAEALAEAQRQVAAYIQRAFGPGRISADIATTEDWARANAVAASRMLIGEIGVHRLPIEAGVDDDGSRLRWLETVRGAIEAAGFGWALYAYRTGFALAMDDGRLDAGMLRALGLPEVE